jgi:hypothetical protein
MMMMRSKTDCSQRLCDLREVMLAVHASLSIDLWTRPLSAETTSAGHSDRRIFIIQASMIVWCCRPVSLDFTAQHRLASCKLRLLPRVSDNVNAPVT